MKLKISYIESPLKFAFIHEEAAKNLGLYEMGRIYITNPETKKVHSIYAFSTKNAARFGYICLPEEVAGILGIEDNETAEVALAPPSVSSSFIRKKIAGEKLTRTEIASIVSDILNNNISPVELSAFITAAKTKGLDMDEIESLTREMLSTSEILSFDTKPIIDHHSIGGVPGNKITLVVIPIIAAAGLMIPKTCSRAITGAGGTGDLMEALSPVAFTSERVKEMTQKVGGVIVWGGATNLVPVDNLIITFENHVNINPYGIMLASVLSKKKAAGTDICILDIPVGIGTKIKSVEEGRKLAHDFVELGRRIGMDVQCVLTNGDEPLGRTLGVNLEVAEALAILENKNMEDSVYSKSCAVAGMALETSGKAKQGCGFEMAEDLIKSGKALAKMKEIISIQGGNPDITSADLAPGIYSRTVHAAQDGRVVLMENRNLVKIARLAGAPSDHGAGIYFYKKTGERVRAGEPLYTIYADNETKLNMALEFARTSKPVLLHSVVVDYVV